MARMSFSSPMTSKPASTKNLTDSEPIRPPEPVMIRVAISYPCPCCPPSAHRTRSENRRNRLEEKPNVCPQGPVRDVDVVELRHLFERNLARPEHLPQPRHAGLAPDPLARPRHDARILLEDERSGTDEAHFALQHVEELGKLILAIAAQEAPDLRDPRIALDLEHPRVSSAIQVHVPVGERVLPSVGISVHRPELEDPKRLLACAHPDLPEEDRPW